MPPEQATPEPNENQVHTLESPQPESSVTPSRDYFQEITGEYDRLAPRVEASGSERASRLHDMLRSFGELAGVIQRQIDEVTPEEDEDTIELERKRVETLERKLGISTRNERMAEASLFVDPPFLRVAEIRGDDHPEEIFGVGQWSSWLQARSEAREIVQLEVEDVCELHATLCQGMAPSKAGELRTTDCTGGDYVDIGGPIEFTERQVAALRENPFVSIQWIKEKKMLGKIDYPDRSDRGRYIDNPEVLSSERRRELGTNPSTSDILRAMLEETIDWLKEEEATAGDDPYRHVKIAAHLQHRIVSIHPFSDGNGRLSRLLMNWYLEKHGLDPSALEYSDQDIFFSREEWANHVRGGQEDYRRKRESTESEHDRAVDPLYVFHSELSRVGGITPPARGRPMRHLEYREYWENLARLYTLYQEFTTPSLGSSDHSSVLGKVELNRAGLIPPAYIVEWGRARGVGDEQFSERYLRGDTTLYRGGWSSGIRNPEDILRVFEEPTAFNSSYRAIHRQRRSPRSIAPISTEQIQRAMIEYNEMVLSDFAQWASSADTNCRIRKIDLDRESDLLGTIGLANRRRLIEKRRKGRYTGHLLFGHVSASGMMSISPAVSTTNTSGVTGNFTDAEPDSAYVGLKVEMSAPKYGTVHSATAERMPMLYYLYGIGNEDEVLVIGGIHPRSVRSVTATRRVWAPSGEPDGGTYVKTEIVAQATMIDDGGIILHDPHKKTRRVYRFNDAGKLVPDDPEVPEPASD